MLIGWIPGPPTLLTMRFTARSPRLSFVPPPPLPPQPWPSRPPPLPLPLLPAVHVVHVVPAAWHPLADLGAGSAYTAPSPPRPMCSFSEPPLHACAERIRIYVEVVTLLCQHGSQTSAGLGSLVCRLVCRAR